MAMKTVMGKLPYGDNVCEVLAVFKNYTPTEGAIQSGYTAQIKKATLEWVHEVVEKLAPEYYEARWFRLLYKLQTRGSHLRKEDELDVVIADESRWMRRDGEVPGSRGCYDDVAVYIHTDNYAVRNEYEGAVVIAWQGGALMFHADTVREKFVIAVLNPQKQELSYYG